MDLDRLDKVDAVLATPFLLLGGCAVVFEKLPNRLLDGALLFVLLVEAWADGAKMVITPLAIIQCVLGQGHHVLPLLRRHTRELEFRTNVARDHEPLALRLANNG